MAQPSTWTAVRSADDIAGRRGSVAAPNLADVLERVLDTGTIIAAGMRHQRRHSGSVSMNGHVKRATYTYAIARPFHPSHLWGVRGVDRTAVHLVHHGELVAVVGTLSFTEADEAVLRARLETPAELEAIARAHHLVVNVVFEHSVTLPFGLATIYQSEQRVVEVLRTGHERFCSALAQLDGRVEVGVTIYSDVVASPAAARIGATLARLSVDHRYLRPQDPRLSGVTEENVLDAAYLIDRASIDAFAALARSLELDQAATRVEITGPWPPYSFVEPADPKCSADIDFVEMAG